METRSIKTQKKFIESKTVADINRYLTGNRF